MDKLIEATNQDLIIENIDLFKQIPQVLESWQTLFSKCLLRQYRTLFGYEDDKAVLVVFFSTNKNKNKKNAHVCGLFGRKKAQQFIDRFYKQLKKEGYTSVTAYSKIEPKLFEKITKLKKEYSVYHKNL